MFRNGTKILLLREIAADSPTACRFLTFVRNDKNAGTPSTSISSVQQCLGLNYSNIIGFCNRSVICGFYTHADPLACVGRINNGI